jgi:hypothetical protein
MRRLLAFSALLLTMSGCGAYYTEYWVRPGSTEAQFEVAASRCESEAEARFPPMTFGMRGYFASPNTWCTPTAGGTNCVLINPGYLPQAQAANDTNEVPRANAFHACLMAGGWHPAGPADNLAAPPVSGMREAAVSEALSYCESIYKPRPPNARTAAYKASFDQCVMTRARELSVPRPPA